jgi:hypothetical protein
LARVFIFDLCPRVPKTGTFNSLKVPKAHIFRKSYQKENKIFLSKSQYHASEKKITIYASKFLAINEINIINFTIIFKEHLTGHRFLKFYIENIKLKLKVHLKPEYFHVSKCSIHRTGNC